MVLLTTLAVAIGIRLTALYISLSRQFYKVEGGTLIILAVFSAFLGLLVPAQGFDVVGIIFRVALFAVIIMVMTRLPFTDSLSVVIVAAIIEAIMVLVLMFTPLNFLVEGMSVFTVP